MLVLTRRVGEGIVIGTDVRVVVNEIRTDKVRVGVDAPASMPVHREEIAEAIAKQGGINQPRSMVYRDELVRTSLEAAGILDKVLVGEFIDPTAVQRCVEMLRRAAGDIRSVEEDRKLRVAIAQQKALERKKYQR